MPPEPPVVPSLMDRLNALDERVLRPHERLVRLGTAKGWAKHVARWWAAPMLGVLLLPVTLLPDMDWEHRLYFSGFACAMFFQGGRLKAEHDRLRGRSLQNAVIESAAPSLRRLVLVAVPLLALTITSWLTPG